MPEDSDVQPPDVYEDNADAVQEPPASPKPKRTSRKKKEAAAPEETVTEEVPTETTESADTAETISVAEEPAVEPDVPAVEEAAAPAPTPSPPRRQPRPQRGEAPVLTIRSRDDVETAEDRDDVIWHEIHNAYRTRKIITGKLGGIEQLDNRKTVAEMCIRDREVTAEHPEGISFGMYHADQYVAPEGQYTTVHAVDGTAWYKQYAVDAVDKSPYMAPDGSIAFNESIVKKLPPAPRRKDKI